MKKIYLSETNKKVAGVLGGIGEAYDIDPTLLRLIVILGAILTAILPFVIAYFLAWLVVPRSAVVKVEKLR